MGRKAQGRFCSKRGFAQAKAVGFLLLLVVAEMAWAGEVPGIVNVRFRNYSVAEGLPQASIIDMAQGSKGYLWFGTQNGLARFDGYEFRVFQHNPDDPQSLAADHVRALVAGEDGELWIGTQSGGLDHYLPGGERFVHFRARDGAPGTLASDSVYALAGGQDGRLWIATLGAKLQWIDPGNSVVHDAPMGRHEALAGARVLWPLLDGSVLVGTAKGLWKVDPAGERMTLWGAGQSDQRLNVFALAVGAAGDVWVGTAAQGLYRFAGDGRLKRHFEHRQGDSGSLPDDQVRALYFDPSGNLWIAGNAKGLALLASGKTKFVRFQHDASDPQSLAANRLWSLGGTRNGLLLVGTWANGLSMHDPRTEMFTQIISLPGNRQTLPAPPAMSIYGNADGTMWVGVHEGGGLVLLDLAHGVTRRYTHKDDDPGSLSNNNVTHIARDPDGYLWVGTQGGGLDRMRADGTGFVHFRHDPDDPASLASDSIRFIYFDSEGTMWVGTTDAGLDERCADCRGFRHYHHEGGKGDGIADINISRVLETSDRALWVGTSSSGLYRRGPDSDVFEHFSAGSKSGLSANGITTLYQDSRGVLWVGTQGGGLNYAKVEKSLHFQVIDKRNGLNSDAIGEILEDGEGNFWVSTIKGISRIDPKSMEVRNFGASDGASALGYWVNSGARLADGRLAFGGLDGITVVNPEALQIASDARPVISALVMSGQRFGLGEALPSGASWSGDTLVLTHEQSDIGAEFASLDFVEPQSVTYSYRLEGYDEDWIETSADRRVAKYTNLSPGHYELLVRARHDAAPWSEQTARLAFTVQSAPWASPIAFAGYLGAFLLVTGGIGWRVRSDMAAKRQSQDAIRLSEERLKLALWGSGSEMWSVDLRNGSVHHENRLAHLAVHKAPSTGRLSDYRPYLHEEDREGFGRALQDHLKGRSATFEASYRTLDTDHNWIWLLSRGRVVERDKDGRAMRLSGTSSDITALKQAEGSLRNLNEQLEVHVQQRTAALREANSELRSTLQRLTDTQQQLLEAEKLAALGSLVAGVAHEINTPLGVGVTAASYLQDEASKLAARVAKGDVAIADLRRFSDHASEGSQIILRNLRRADSLVKSFKQVAVEQASEDVRTVNLKDCINDIVTTLGPSLRRGAHRVEVECPAKLELRTSPGALYQIVTNLMVNSLTHGFSAREPGRILIALARQGAEVQLDYRDDGCGMTDEVRAHVFDPFFTTRRGQGGSGLGMHIVYNLVTQALKGHIELETAPGKGVHVQITMADLPEEEARSAG